MKPEVEGLLQGLVDALQDNICQSLSVIRLATENSTRVQGLLLRAKTEGEWKRTSSVDVVLVVGHPYIIRELISPEEVSDPCLAVWFVGEWEVIGGKLSQNYGPSLIVEVLV